MLVTFRTKAHADIMMFGEIAIQLLKLAGHSGTVPTAIMAKDAAAFAVRLEAGLRGAATADRPDARANGTRPNGDDAEAEPAVPIAKRAVPLLELLRAAAARGADVMVTATGA